MNTETKPPIYPSTGYNSISFMGKSLLIGLFALVLLIPLQLVHFQVDSRQSTSKAVKQEITARWGQSQCIRTPILVIPYTQTNKNEEKELHIFPRQLTSKAQLEVQRRHRTIYEVAVYDATVNISGTWKAEDILEALKEVPGTHRLDEAKITFAISDRVGYLDAVQIQLNDTILKMKSAPKATMCGYFDGEYNDSPAIEWDYSTDMVGPLTAKYPIHDLQELQDLKFSLDTKVRGSDKFGIIACGISAQSTIDGNWDNVAFMGNKIPTTSRSDKDGFSAEYSTFLEENYVTTDDNYSSLLFNSYFVNLIIPVDCYAQTDRSINYGILVIILTILSVYLTELSLRRQGRTINAIHYILTGSSLVLYYALLLSFSEVTGFGWAYLIASVMTIGLNTAYFRMILRDKKQALILCAISSILYLAIYVLLQIETYALLAGSILLFVILALVMYYSATITKDRP